ncbi:MAG TPA: exonuclease domain-containing protein [Candidatus Bathyarchaeia archaeon]|nr:exonuclease domain-containing protein [Candidatus Bathyarchaeia archaeon]
MKPFSENIIFLDTEFSSLDPNKGEILSIGLVKLNGEELYLELEYDGEVSDWVKENVIPFLTQEKMNREKAVEKVKQFIGDAKPYIVGYINQDDVMYWQKLYRSVGVKENPFQLVAIDFATILFMLGIDPESYYFGDENNFYKKIGIDYTKYKKHHALDDAKLLREVYLKFIEKI